VWEVEGSSLQWGFERSASADHLYSFVACGVQIIGKCRGNSALPPKQGMRGKLKPWAPALFPCFAVAAPTKFPCFAHIRSEGILPADLGERRARRQPHSALKRSIEGGRLLPSYPGPCLHSAFIRGRKVAERWKRLRNYLKSLISAKRQQSAYVRAQLTPSSSNGFPEFRKSATLTWSRHGPAPRFLRL